LAPFQGIGDFGDGDIAARLELRAGKRCQPHPALQFSGLLDIAQHPEHIDRHVPQTVTDAGIASGLTHENGPSIEGFHIEMR